MSIGSIKVNTINLMRIAYESQKNQKQYLSLLKKRTTLCCKTLDTIRHIISRNIEKGLLPNYCDGGIEIAKQYCTVGILGLYEVIEYFGLTEKDEFGNVSYTDEGIEFASEIFKVLNEVKNIEVYGIFGGAQNFQQQASLLQQRIPVGVTPEQYANQLLQSGQITQDRLNWAMNIANQFYGR